MSDTDLQARVVRCIADCLALKPGDIRADARLIDDLGADSLDFIDILFGLEQEFGLKLRSADVEGFLRADFSEAKLVDGRYLDAATLDRLAPWLPRLRQAADLQKLTPVAVFSYIGVDTFVRIVQAAGKPD